MKKEFCNAYTKQLFNDLVKAHTSGSKRSKFEFAEITGKRYNWVCDKFRGKESISFEKLIYMLHLMGYKNLNEIDFPIRALDAHETFFKPKRKKPKLKKRKAKRDVRRI